LSPGFDNVAADLPNFGDTAILSALATTESAASGQQGRQIPKAPDQVLPPQTTIIRVS
jgi:hypothetical protein